MPLYLIERNFAERLDTSQEDIGDILKANDTADVDWLFSFLSADKRKTYCLYEATSTEAIRKAAGIANLPVNAIIEVDKISPETWGFPASSNVSANGTD